METKKIIENLLFISGEPISIKKLSQILEIEESETTKEVDELKKDSANRGLKIIEKDKKIQITTSPEASKYIEKLITSNLKEELSETAMETLAAISYLGPIAKHELEELRGVNCAFTLRNLLIRGLIEKAENPENTKTLLYKTSFDFLKKLGIENEKELPDYRKYREDIKSAIEHNPSILEHK